MFFNPGDMIGKFRWTPQTEDWDRAHAECADQEAMRQDALAEGGDPEPVVIDELVNLAQRDNPFGSGRERDLHGMDADDARNDEPVAFDVRFREVRTKRERYDLVAHNGDGDVVIGRSPTASARTVSSVT
jgi:hypothetical protein